LPGLSGAICSLCCTLDARCGDLCKPQASLSAQWSGTLRWLLPRRIWPYLDTGLGNFLLLMLIIVPLLASVFGLLYHQEINPIGVLIDPAASEAALRSGFLKAFMVLLVMAGMVAWWLVLARSATGPLTRRPHGARRLGVTVGGHARRNCPLFLRARASSPLVLASPTLRGDVDPPKSKEPKKTRAKTCPRTPRRPNYQRPMALRIFPSGLSDLEK
jgi:hypothetical protein